MIGSGSRGSADRAETMGRRLDRTAARLRIDGDGRRVIAAAFQAAMEVRRAAIDDDHHPDYLHPARTVLILMDDLGVADPHLLAAAAFAETRDPSLAAPIGMLERISDPAAGALARIPVPAVEEDRLLESLLALPTPLGLVAGAERLDHARHLHLRFREEWAPYHALTCGSYAPVAARHSSTLGERLRWWCSTFERRFIEP